MNVLVWVLSFALVLLLGWLLLSNLRERTTPKMVLGVAVAVTIAVGYVWLHNTNAVGEVWNQTIPLTVLAVVAVWFVAYWRKQKGARRADS